MVDTFDLSLLIGLYSIFSYFSKASIGRSNSKINLLARTRVHESNRQFEN